PYEQGSKVVSFRKLGVDRERTIAHLLRLLVPAAFGIPPVGKPAVCIGEPDERKGTGWIDGASVLEHLDRPVVVRNRFLQQGYATSDAELEHIPGGLDPSVQP